MVRQAAPAARKPAKKGREQKLQRKQELERIQEKEALVKAANQVADPLAPFAPFRTYARRGVDAAITCLRGSEAPQVTSDWAFTLCKANMQAFYEGARDMGWSDAKKRVQLTAPEARLLVVTGKVDGGEEQPLAYAHFRFEMEGECPVLYCWELQVEKGAKRRGLGRFLMQLLELIACRAGMEWVMLTVMSANAEAFTLYTVLGYTMDETSPSACDALDNAGYEILSKKLPARKAPPPANAPQLKAAAVAKPAAADAAAGAAVTGGLREPMAALAVN